MLVEKREQVRITYGKARFDVKCDVCGVVILEGHEGCLARGLDEAHVLCVDCSGKVYLNKFQTSVNRFIEIVRRFGL